MSNFPYIDFSDVITLPMNIVEQSLLYFNFNYIGIIIHCF
jgi:hypothetical protein